MISKPCLTQEIDMERPCKQAKGKVEWSFHLLDILRAHICQNSTMDIHILLGSWLYSMFGLGVDRKTICRHWSHGRRKEEALGKSDVCTLLSDTVVLRRSRLHLSLCPVSILLHMRLCFRKVCPRNLHLYHSEARQSRFSERWLLLCLWLSRCLLPPLVVVA